VIRRFIHSETVINVVNKLICTINPLAFRFPSTGKYTGAGIISVKLKTG
jgi:hypothetical protein